MRPISRRTFLAAAGALGTGAVLTRGTSKADAGLVLPGGRGGVAAALAALGRETLRFPGSVPYPELPPGTDTMPGIRHVVVLMLENHSFDNVLGLLGRGDGLTTDPRAVTAWNPAGVTNTNPYGDGRVQHAFRMPMTCQLHSRPSQEWTASHNSFDGGRMDGFVRTPISFGTNERVGGVAMGYWTAADLPVLHGIAGQFPVADRWFCSVLGQTDPNRRFLIAATASGMTDDISLSVSNPSVEMVEQDALLALPANGTIFDRLSAFGISWADYTASYPTGTTAELYPLDDAALTALNERPIAQFFTDCRRGTLPAFSLLDPDFSTQSQENPQDMTVGEAFLAEVLGAVGTPGTWEHTLLVVVYDEHGGYYDHVPPPVALAPDAIAPVVQPGQQAYDGYCRYGMRVPAVVVSPYAVPAGLTTTLYDHTSILAMVERKWNLPALTFRDANANDLTRFLDMTALAARTPTFPSMPAIGVPAQSNCPDPLPVVPPPASISG